MSDVHYIYKGLAGGLLAVGFIDLNVGNPWMSFALLLSGVASIFMALDQA